MQGWALAYQGQTKEGIAQINQGLITFQPAGTKLGRPSHLALLADAYGLMGQQDAGLELLKQALTLTDTTGERWYEAECYRLKGVLLLLQNEVFAMQGVIGFDTAHFKEQRHAWMHSGHRWSASPMVAYDSNARCTSTGRHASLSGQNSNPPLSSRYPPAQ